MEFITPKSEIEMEIMEKLGYCKTQIYTGQYDKYLLGELPKLEREKILAIRHMKVNEAMIKLKLEHECFQEEIDYYKELQKYGSAGTF